MLRSPSIKRIPAEEDRENPNPSRCLGVFNLNYATTSDDLNAAFQKFGQVEKVSCWWHLVSINDLPLYTGHSKYSTNLLNKICSFLEDHFEN